MALEVSTQSISCFIVSSAKEKVTTHINRIVVHTNTGKEVTDFSTQKYLQKLKPRGLTFTSNTWV